MRDIIVSLLLVSLMPACYRRPFVGLCVFSWLAYMRVQDLTWGFAREIRWSYYVAILTIGGFFTSRERRPAAFDIRTVIMVVLVVWIGLGVYMSERSSFYQFRRYMEFTKIIGIAVLTTAMVTNKERLRVMVWIIALSLGFYGLKSGVWGIMTGGRMRILRGPGGMLADNNDLAMALAMAVPMLFMLGWTERKKEVRRAFWFVLPFTVISVGLTQSRGGFLAVAAGIWMMIFRSRNRLIGVFIGLMVAGAAVLMMPEDYKQRLETLKDPTAEGSAASRIRAWIIASRMAIDNPWFGVGMQKFRQHYMEYNLDPDTKEAQEGAVIVAHSSYFQIWAECGTPALVLYFILIITSLATCWRVRKMAKARYYSSWIINYATMFEASMAAFLVGASFLNRGHYDLFYHWVALILVFGRIATNEMRNEEIYPERAVSGRGPVQAVRRRGFGPRNVPGEVPRVATGRV